MQGLDQAGGLNGFNQQAELGVSGQAFDDVGVIAVATAASGQCQNGASGRSVLQETTFAEIGRDLSLN